MRGSVTILICVLWLAGFAAAQSNSVESDFNKNKAKYTREFLGMGEDSSSGYDYVFYKSGPKIVMIRVIWSASYTNELRISDFYFDDDLAFHRKQTARKRQLSLLKRGRDIPLTVKEEHHFAGGKLTKWILDSKTIPSTDTRWVTTEKEILEEARSERESYTLPKRESMRKPVIAGNWKMYKLLSEAADAAVALKSLVANANHCDIVVAPVYTALKTVVDRLEGSNIHVAAQDCAAESKTGAHTGEVAADMIKDVGCSHTIVGHSERRQLYGDTDATVNLKTRSALGVGLIAIVCVGETLDEREGGNAERVVKTQLTKGLEGLTLADTERIIIAYEPVWAIGTGKTATPEQAQEMHGVVRRTVAETHGQEVAGKLRILYGGSVKPDNIRDLMSQEDVDGALVGGASLEAESFARIVNYR